MKINIFDKLTFLSLFLVITLLPVFFLPFTNIPVETSKGLLLVSGLLLAVIFWAIARFSDGQITIPRSWCLFSGGGVVLAVLLSTIFSVSSNVSLFGTMFDVGTFWFIFAGFLIMALSSVVFKDAKDAKIVLFGAILSSAVVLVFQSVHLFLPNALSFGVLSGKTGNILGSWNAFGIFAGFSALMSLLVLEFFSTTRIEKIILESLIILSMLLVAVVNFPLIWILLGISGLIIFTYKVSINFHTKSEEGEKKKDFPLFSFFITMVALFFFMSGNLIGGILPDRLGISNNEVSPSLSATMSVTKAVIKHNPVFGIGPNRFDEAWANYKPAAINGTAFWDVSFSSGSGLLPTLLATTGILGILAWVVFFVLFIISGVKSIFSSIRNGANWETMAFFVLSLYLFISSFFYSGGTVIFLLAMVFAGVFLGLSSSSREGGELVLSFLNDHRKSFFSILFLILIILLSAAASFRYFERLASVSYFGKALTAKDVNGAESSITKALALYTNDLYLRTYGQVYLLKLNSIAQKGGSSLSDSDKALLQTNLNQAVNGVQGATLYNPKSYINWQSLGSLYQSLATFGVKDAYTKAIEAYKTASTLNPNNPGIKLAIANAYFASEDNKQAKEYIKMALNLKPDYIDAYILLSQIAKNEGNNEDAVGYAEVALSLYPDNKDLSAYVDALKNSKSSTVTPPPSTPTPSTSTNTTNSPVKGKK